MPDTPPATGDTPKTDAPASDSNNSDATPATPATDEIGDAGKRAIAIERKARLESDKRARDLEKRVAEFEDRDKTETERLTARAEAAERELSEFKTRDLARTVAANEGVPELWDLLHGDEDQMTAQAKRLAEHAKPAENDTNSPDLGAGARGGDRNVKTGSKGFSAAIRRGAGYGG